MRTLNNGGVLMYDGGNHFPHDGKQGRCGCGEGYSWNDNNYGRHSGGSSGGGGNGYKNIFDCSCRVQHYWCI